MELERVANQARGTEAKLASEQFVARAPESVVASEREKLISLQDQQRRLQEKLQSLQ